MQEAIQKIIVLLKYVSAQLTRLSDKPENEILILFILVYLEVSQHFTLGYLDILEYLADDVENTNYTSVHMTSNCSRPMKWF